MSEPVEFYSERFFYDRTQVDNISELLKQNDNRISATWWYLKLQWPRVSTEVLLDLVEDIRSGKDMFADRGHELRISNE